MGVLILPHWHWCWHARVRLGDWLCSVGNADPCHREKYFVRAGAWCWVSEAYEDDRLALHYICKYNNLLQAHQAYRHLRGLLGPVRHSRDLHHHIFHVAAQDQAAFCSTCSIRRSRQRSEYRHDQIRQPHHKADDALPLRLCSAHPSSQRWQDVEHGTQRHTIQRRLCLRCRSHDHQLRLGGQLTLHTYPP